MTTFISMYIDDELSLDEKIEFMERIKNDPSIADKAIHLLTQEKRIQDDVVNRVPPIEISREPGWKRFLAAFWQPMNLVSASLAVAVIVLAFLLLSPQQTLYQNRFVIYRPDITRAEITGSFTNWQRVPMQSLGDSGYWEAVLALPQGEHRFSYIIDGAESFPDPTIQTRERDDFGGQNSIIFVGEEV